MWKLNSLQFLLVDCSFFSIALCPHEACYLQWYGIGEEWSTNRALLIGLKSGASRKSNAFGRMDASMLPSRLDVLNGTPSPMLQAEQAQRTEAGQVGARPLRKCSQTAEIKCSRPETPARILADFRCRRRAPMQFGSARSSSVSNVQFDILPGHRDRRSPSSSLWRCLVDTNSFAQFRRALTDNHQTISLPYYTPAI